ncbi:hydrogenase nickel incorporation protein HypB (plasmid) [Acaryochloris sp. 'Moss Beach']|uniref:hydrogenase nickel incorporation protein HypB n=1 Tax=Acaryochloris TaxID=155977 RepID=UPI001BAF0F3C|nr:MULTISPECIES: hydrogenase nickel incorporation protein HypB [Acaryochloris]QUY46061.1 hydrogenase nickel incorporation protein HypB [Acaryochloris marina S15]UJB72604.1 hydrogenase nickel incorporation protein HypB [Acaryochloris sp. 'Moss Beach']
MCEDCGCSAGSVQIHQGHDPQPNKTTTSLEVPTPSVRHLDLHAKILEHNDRIADQNRALFHQQGWLVVNILSSPGSGKTALIERLAQDQRNNWQIGTIVGDLATDNDAHRLGHAGVSAVQITTGTACHLEASMVSHALSKLPSKPWDLLVIENVGNLVCPAAFDLGEQIRVVVLSVTEGEDKPQKYPAMFKSAQVVLINKTDIAEAVGWQRDLAIANLQQIAPQATLFEVSARTGAGMHAWYAYLDQCRQGLNGPLSRSQNSQVLQIGRLSSN